MGQIYNGGANGKIIKKMKKFLEGVDRKSSRWGDRVFFSSLLGPGS